MGRRDQDVHFLASKEEVQRIHEKMAVSYTHLTLPTTPYV